MPQLDRPLSYIDWVQTVDLSVTSESDLFSQYKSYVAQFYVTRESDKIDRSEAVKTLYRDLLKEITLNFSTIDERRFLSNVDFTNPKELDIVIPYYVKKLKDITQYIVKKRQEVQFTKIQKSLKGSDEGISTIIKNTIINTLNDKDFTEKYPDSNIPQLSAVANSISIEIDTLYDDYQDYFDNDPNLTADKFTDSSDESLFNLYTNNVEDIDTDLWLDFTKAIEALFDEIPILLESQSFELETSINQSLGINFRRTDINDLPYRYFVSTSKATEDLAIQYKKLLASKFAGTTMYYASGDVGGILYEPQHKTGNILNRYYSSHATVPSVGKLKPFKSKGGYFLPHKEGLLNYAGHDSYVELDENAITEDIQTYPDPTVYGTGRGNTKSDQKSPFNTTDDISSIKQSKSDSQGHGDLSDSNKLQKFYPYQSREETLDLHATGVSRAQDDVDFWSGNKKDLWAHSDIYPIKSVNSLPITEKMDDLLISNQVLYQWRTDIYGNEYALYKPTHPTRRTTEQIDNNLVGSTTRNTATTDFKTTSGQFFQERTTNYYDYTLSSFNTVYEDESSSLTSSKTVYSRGTSIGNFYFRNIYSNVISPVSSALSAVFIKYRGDTDIINQLYNNVIQFDIIDNVVIIETPLFLVIEKFNFDFDTGIFTSTLPKKVFLSLSGRPSDFEKYSNLWYDDIDNDIYLTHTVVHPWLSATNYKVVYPNIYRFNIDDQQLYNLYNLDVIAPKGVTRTVKSDYATLTGEGFSTSELGVRVSLTSAAHINVTSVGKPSMAYNKNDNTMSINAIVSDQSSGMYIYNWYFDTSNQHLFGVKKLDLFKPDVQIYNHTNKNFYANSTTSEPALSSFYYGELERGAPLEQKMISFDSFTSKYNFFGKNYTLSHNSSLSGRTINPTAYIDIDTNTIRLGAGISANDKVLAPNGPKEEVAGYSHNSSYLLYNPALSGGANDIVVTFEVALYTNTSVNSGYVQINRT